MGRFQITAFQSRMDVTCCVSLPVGNNNFNNLKKKYYTNKNYCYICIFYANS